MFKVITLKNWLIYKQRVSFSVPFGFGSRSLGLKDSNLKLYFLQFGHSQFVFTPFFHTL